MAFMSIFIEYDAPLVGSVGVAVGVLVGGNGVLVGVIVGGVIVGRATVRVTVGVAVAGVGEGVAAHDRTNTMLMTSASIDPSRTTTHHLLVPVNPTPYLPSFS